ncbi:hypothetical protein C8Q77DRAFT_1159701 [Trametes polyzona]|nr:hypothetical protein C8Q77DRAFT_1159701 [Trametes polyzona]
MYMDASNPGYDGDSGLDDAERAVGHISNENKHVLETAYAEVLQKAKAIAASTGLAVSQVFDQWFAPHSNRASKDNKWNLYGSYFAQNTQEEISYLSEEVVNAPGFSAMSAITRRMCYEKFQDRHGSRVFAILQKHRALLELRQAQKHTVAQRRADFNKSVKKMKDLMDSFQNVHGFSGVCALIGNVVNSDTALAMVHETEDAVGFFETRCQTDHDGVISHLKVHVYHNVSLGHVELTSGDAGRSKGATTKTKAHVSTAKDSGSTRTKGKGKGHHTDDNNDGSGDDDVDAAADSIDDDDDEDEDDESGEPSLKERAKYIKKCLYRCLHAIGVEGLISDSMWSWKTMVSKLVSQGIVIRNWPEGIGLPPRPPKCGETKVPTCPEFKKGVTGMPSFALDILVAALRHPSHPLRFEVHRRGASAITKIIMPVIYGAPPTAKQHNARARRMFYDGTVDHKGEPRQVLPRNTDASDDIMDASGEISEEDRADSTTPPESENESTPLARSRRVLAADLTAVQVKPGPPTPTGPPMRVNTFGAEFREVRVEVPTPKKSRRPMPKPRQVIKLDSSGDEHNDCSPSPTPRPTRDAARRKKRARSTTPVLAPSSEHESAHIESAPKLAKGKRPHQRRDVPRETPAGPHINVVAPAHDGEIARPLKQRRINTLQPCEVQGALMTSRDAGQAHSNPGYGNEADAQQRANVTIPHIPEPFPPVSTLTPPPPPPPHIAGQAPNPHGYYHQDNAGSNVWHNAYSAQGHVQPHVAAPPPPPSIAGQAPDPRGYHHQEANRNTEHDIVAPGPHYDVQVPIRTYMATGSPTRVWYTPKTSQAATCHHREHRTRQAACLRSFWLRIQTMESLHAVDFQPRMVIQCIPFKMFMRAVAGPPTESILISCVSGTRRG